MSESTESTPTAAAAPKKRPGGLSGMLIADLKAMAAGMGISGAGSMKKAQLVAAIKAAQAGSGPAKPPSSNTAPAARAGADEAVAQDRPVKQDDSKTSDETGGDNQRRRERNADRGKADQQGGRQQGSQKQDKNQDQKQDQQSGGKQDQQGKQDQSGKQGDQQGKQDQSGKQAEKQGKQDQSGKQAEKQGKQDQGNQQQGNQQHDDQQGGGRNRRRRGRDRSERGGRNRGEPDTTILEDDVLVPAAGILDVLDNYAFVRTSGYLPGADDVYVSLSMVRKFGLRRGDAVVGQVRQPREGERKEKFNPMVRIDAVNGADPEAARSRPEFAKLTPVHPAERLRLETGPDDLVGRVIDIAAPVGKGQRGLIAAPPRSGKTAILQAIANSVTTNNPECHLMVVLVDERPEEVTDFERSVKGEVISSTFDHAAGDHTTVAELSIERAKRLVELGHDVVVLLDGITRLGRAYNHSTSSSGRVLSGGVDAASLHPPKRFFGAARNIEDGGSLTILATVTVESGARVDEVILEEFQGTENLELRLRRELADQRIFPPIDVVASGTRREDLLMGAEEMEIVAKLRRHLSGLEPKAAMDTLLGRLEKSQNNIEFLTRVQKSTLSETAQS